MAIATISDDISLLIPTTYITEEFKIIAWDAADGLRRVRTQPIIHFF